MEAFKFGPPPHGGLAFRVDRMVMFMAGTENIKDVIAFPKNQKTFCYLTYMNRVVCKSELEELEISI